MLLLLLLFDKVVDMIQDRFILQEGKRDRNVRIKIMDRNKDENFTRLNAMTGKYTHSVCLF